MWMHSEHLGDNLLPWLIVTAVSLVAAAWDATQRRIPNWLTGPTWALGLIWAGWVASPGGVGESLLGSTVMAVPYIILFVFGGGGAGDAKLMAAIGAWLGLWPGMFALVCITVTGAVVGAAFAVGRRQTGEVAATLYVMLFGLVLRPLGLRNSLAFATPEESASGRRRRAFPYGIAIFAGTLAASLGAVLWAK
jgi:prepilin peptidase CpaA